MCLHDDAGWSTLNAADVDIPGIGLTSANFRLGLFAMRAQIKQAGLLPFATQCYSWCDEEAMQPGPFSGDHDRAYCTLLRTAQLGAVTSAALGFTAFLSMLALSTNLIRYATRRHVSAFSASIVLLQALTGLQTIVAWACIRKIANSDLRESFGPGQLHASCTSPQPRQQDTAHVHRLGMYINRVRAGLLHRMVPHRCRRLRRPRELRPARLLHARREQEDLAHGHGRGGLQDAWIARCSDGGRG